MRLLPLCVLGLSAASAFSCKDQDNNDVDWWFAYKMPKFKGDNGIKELADGYAFYYLDANNPTFVPSAKDLSSEDQAVAYTLNQLYKVIEDSSVFHALYSDQVPAEELGFLEKYENDTDFWSLKYGHTKGVTFFDKSSGVWFVHSVPKFPSIHGYRYPESATIYGQSMLCISLKYDQLKKVGTQLYFNRPDIYSSNLPTSMVQDNPDLAKVIGKKYQKGEPTSSVLELTTIAGATFRSFAKSEDFEKDLYTGLVAPVLKTPLNVETWRRGSKIGLECSVGDRVLDILTMKVGSCPEFKYTKDHSKTAISASASSPHVCIGDVNRMQTQYSRGGGTVCFANKAVWTAYSSSIISTNSC